MSRARITAVVLCCLLLGTGHAKPSTTHEERAQQQQSEQQQSKHQPKSCVRRAPRENWMSRTADWVRERVGAKPNQAPKKQGAAS